MTTLYSPVACATSRADDAELEQELLDVAREPRAPGRVGDLDARAGEPAHDPSPVNSACRNAPSRRDGGPDDLGHPLVGAAQALHLVEARPPQADRFCTSSSCRAAPDAIVRPS